MSYKWVSLLELVYQRDNNLPKSYTLLVQEPIWVWYSLPVSWQCYSKILYGADLDVTGPQMPQANS
jgi:hypothetical protein